MRILSVHNYYQIRGGEDECHEAEITLLRKHGHTVDVYEAKNDEIAALNPVQTAVQTIWSQSTYQAIKQRLSHQQYDIVQVQNFFPLISPSVYYAARECGVPVVQTLHNYRLLCPNALFFREGKVCEDCLGKPIPYPGVLHRCYRESWAASTGVAALLTTHRLLQTWQHTVTQYIALTDFARQKFIQGGLPAEKILVKPHFVDPDPGPGTGQGGYALYVGRLSVEKGLDTLLQAWQQLAQPMPLKIVGDGPLADQVQQAAAQNPLVEWLGRRPVAEVYALMGDAKVLIMASKWYETFGRVVIEAFAKGTPVIAANIGAVAELVAPEQTGLLFCPGDPGDLAKKVEWLLAHPERSAQMRQHARHEFETKYTAAHSYQQLIDLYRQVKANCR